MDEVLRSVWPILQITAEMRSIIIAQISGTDSVRQDDDRERDQPGEEENDSRVNAAVYLRRKQEIK